jgi:hypothetical protein
MMTDEFRRRLLHALAVALMIAAIPAPGLAEDGEGRDSHDKTRDDKKDGRKKEPGNPPRNPYVKDFSEARRIRP